MMVASTCVCLEMSSTALLQRQLAQSMLLLIIERYRRQSAQLGTYMKMWLGLLFRDRSAWCAQFMSTI